MIRTLLFTVLGIAGEALAALSALADDRPEVLAVANRLRQARPTAGNCSLGPRL
jgi:hypothetical protein